MLLIYNSNGKLENVKAEVEQTAETRSLLELESLHNRLRCPKCPKEDGCSHSRNSENLNLNHCCQTSKYDSDGDINMQVLFSSPPSIPSIIYFILPVNIVSFIKQDAVHHFLCDLSQAQCYIHLR